VPQQQQQQQQQPQQQQQQMTNYYSHPAPGGGAMATVQIQIRGVCGVCKQNVYDNQDREKDPATGVYKHLNPQDCKVATVQQPASTTHLADAGGPSAGAGRAKRWGDGLEAPAAGTRHFVPPGFEVTRDVAQSIQMFGHTPAHVADIVEAGRSKAATSPFPLAAAHAAALYAYTEESPLYGTLNYTMRTPHTQKTPTDTQLEFFADYIVHSERALNCLPTHVSEKDGAIYRGIRVLLNPSLYAPGKQFTWQAFSSATSKQIATLEFVQVFPGRKLSGSLFVIHSITAKDIRHFSAFPSEEEVLFPSNSQFKVERVVTSVPDKAALLTDLTAYDLSDLDVYVIKQVA